MVGQEVHTLLSMARSGNLLDCFNRNLDVFFCVKRTDPESNTSVNFNEPQLFMDKGCTVQTSPARDVVIHIEYCSCIQSLEAFDIE